MDNDSVRPIRPEAKGLTLADISVTWEHREGECRVTRTITGRQIAQLITAAAHQSHNDQTLGTAGAAGWWTYQLRGLSALVFPDAGVSVHEADARATLSNILHRASAELEAELLDSEEWPRGFRIESA
jgi:hypothetical protein